MTRITDLANIAAQEKKAGNREEALSLYSEAFDILVKEAMRYALKYEDATEKVDGELVARTEFKNKVKEYYRKDEVACRISNNMGVLFVELGNVQAAKDMFTQAIDLTPIGVTYEDPVESLHLLETVTN